MVCVDLASRTEVNQFNNVIVGASEVDVVGLNIAMDDSLRVQVRNCRDQLFYYFGSFCFAKMLVSLQSLENRPTVHHFVDKVELFGVFKHFDDFTNIRMVKLP